MSSDKLLPSAVPIYARLSDIGVVGDLEGKYSTTRPDYFVKVYVDDQRVVKSEKKPRVPAPRWEKGHQFLVHPSSTMKIILYRKGRTCIKHLVGAHSGKVTDLLENDTPLDIKDQIGTGIAPKIKITLCLVSDSKTEMNFKNFMGVIDANVSRLDVSTTDRVPAGVSTTLANALQLTKNIMDVVSDAHPILKASWTFMSAVYKAVEQVELSDNNIRDLAESLRELLTAAKKAPDVLVIEGATNVIEEIGRTSLKVASLIHEYTRLSFKRRIMSTQLSDDMKTRIAQCQQSCDDLRQKFDRRVIMDTLQQVKELVVINSNTQDKQLAKEIYEWLSAPDNFKNYYEARKKHQTDTCSWFLDGARFREWLKDSNFLWIKGTAGCGKTILCSSIIKKVIELCKEKQSTASAYFFFDGRDSQGDLQLHDKLIRSLIFQLSRQCDGIPAALVELYGHGYQQPSTSDLQDALHLIINGLPSTYIIIDSLDECTERDEALQWITQIVSYQMDNLHIMVTSRPERDITQVFQSLDPYHVDLALAGELSQDIAIYLDQQLTVVRYWSDETRELVKLSLTTGAHGIFRWVALQLQELKKYKRGDAVAERLLCLPASLNETYDRILLKITDAIERADSKTFLRWLCFSRRPITIEELAEAVTVDLEAKDGPRYMPLRRYHDPRSVLDTFSGFISESEGKIKLAHFSIKEYLLSEYLLTGPISCFHLTEELSHAFISQTCLAYLLQFDALDSTFESFPLAAYAAEHWISHAQSGGINKPELSSESACTLILAQKLFTSDGAALTNWIRIWDVGRATSAYYLESEHRNDIGAPLYYASHAGLQRLVQYLLENADVNAQGGGYGNALQAASYRGHYVIAKLLLANGADANMQGGYYGSALQAASSEGYNAIVKLLLEREADANAQGGYFGNALQAASYCGDETTVKLLLERWTDVNADGGYYGSALHAASLEGHEKIVKLLLDKGANVDACGGRLGNALQAASSEGREAIVKLLLDKRADVNAQGGYYGNALQAASYWGHEAIVKLLLRKGADVNAQGGVSESALQAASLGAREATVRLLLENGADINAQGGKYGTALQAASYQGHVAIVKLLLERGADVNARAGRLVNALQAASSEGQETIVKLLLGKKADVNAQGGGFGNALQLASYGGHEATVKLLLQMGADVNAQGGALGSALQAASFEGNEATVKLLLEKGADVNAKGGKFGNAFQAASYRGHKTIMQLLLENGADISILP